MGSSACSTSMKAAMPPSFCASATTCSAIVVLPDDSGPKISTMRPRGNPPTPSALSSEMEPEEMAATCTIASFDPSRTMEPLPNCFSIWPRVSPRVRVRSFSSIKRSPSKMSRGRTSIVLEFRGVVSFAGAHDQLFVPLHANLHRMIETVGPYRLGAIKDVVLVPQLVGDVFKVLVQVARLERKERLAAGFTGEITQHLVAVGVDARDIRGDAVDVYVGFLRHLQRLIPRVAALVIFPVAQNDHGAAEFVERLIFHQLVAAGEEDGVIKRRSATRPQVRNGFFQVADIVGQIRHQLGRGIEAHDHGLVVLWPDSAVDEGGGRFLLEMETVANAVAGVDQDRQAQRQVGFG